MSHFLKKFTKIFGRHVDAVGNLLQRQRHFIRAFYKFQNLLELQDPPVVAGVDLRRGMIMVFRKDRTDHLIQGSKDDHLVSRPPGSHRVEHPPDDAVELLIGFRIKILRLDLMFCNPADHPAAGIIFIHENIHIKYQTVIFTVVGYPLMQDTGRNKDEHAGRSVKFLFIDGQVQGAL